MREYVRTKYKEGKKTKTVTEAVTYDQSDIEGLVERAAGGDFEVFSELYSIYLDKIYRYVFYQVKDRMTAEDITEDVFVKAWKAIGTCKGKGKTFLSWLYRIAHNHVIDYLRKMQKYTSIEEMENMVTISDPKLELEAELEHQELLELVACLPQNQRQVIILKFIEDMGNREIGRIMNKKEGAIRVLQMRALATLRQKLGGGARDEK
jgi:RNA polymerase sigma-70 factor (ECF subfamily)